MAITWRDAVSAVALGLIIIVYMSHLSDGSWLLSSTWATAAVILLLGIGGRAIGVHGDAHRRPKEWFPALLRRIASALGVVALAAGLIALLGDSAFALRILVLTSIVVWGAISLGHVYLPAGD
jgi:hypothetical protein